MILWFNLRKPWEFADLHSPSHKLSKLKRSFNMAWANSRSLVDGFRARTICCSISTTFLRTVPWHTACAFGEFFFGFAEWLAEGNRLRCFDYQGLFDPDLLRSSGEIWNHWWGWETSTYLGLRRFGAAKIFVPHPKRGGERTLWIGGSTLATWTYLLVFPNVFLIAVCRLYPAQNQTGTILSLQHVSVGHASASADIHQGILVVLLVIYGTNVTPATTVVVRKQGKKQKYHAPIAKCFCRTCICLDTHRRSGRTYKSHRVHT